MGQREANDESEEVLSRGMLPPGIGGVGFGSSPTWQRFSVPSIIVFPKTFSVDSLNAYINVFMTMDTLATCAHHVTPSAEYPACPSSEYPTTSLSSCSEPSYPRAYTDDKQEAGALHCLSTVEGIQEDMIQFGSVTVAFTVYEDFPTYTSGVYHYVNGSKLDGHVIKIFGWSSEGGEDCWLVANSWNDECGDPVDEKVDSFARDWRGTEVFQWRPRVRRGRRGRGRVSAHDTQIPPPVFSQWSYACLQFDLCTSRVQLQPSMILTVAGGSRTEKMSASSDL